LLQLLQGRPGRFGDYLWLLLIEEHMLSYRRHVREQVLAQLASPLLQAEPTAAAPSLPLGVGIPQQPEVAVPIGDA
jgi:hypothetical protein